MSDLTMQGMLDEMVVKLREANETIDYLRSELVQARRQLGGRFPNEEHYRQFMTNIPRLRALPPLKD